MCHLYSCAVKKRAFLGIFLVVVLGCGSFTGCGKGSVGTDDKPPIEWVEIQIPADRTEAATSFAVELAKAANPMSAERAIPQGFCSQ